MIRRILVKMETITKIAESNVMPTMLNLHNTLFTKKANGFVGILNLVAERK